jgi:DNA-binding transcriptional LysR family regulator
LLLHGMDDRPFVIDGKLQRVPVSGRFAASTVDAIRAACIRGSGLALMTYWDVWNELDLGRLERIDLQTPSPTNWAFGGFCHRVAIHLLGCAP